MDNWLNLFNTREIAMAVWLAIGLILLLLRGDTRRSFLQLLKSFFQWKILLIVLAMLLYVGLEVFGLYRVGFWDASLLKDTVLWTLGVAFVLLIDDGTSAQDEHYFRRALLDNIKVVAFLEFMVNLRTFNVWVEIILVPVLFFVGGMSAVAESDKKYLPAKKVIDLVITAFGIYLIGFAVVSMVHDYRGFATTDNLRSFLLPLLLTLVYLPFLYATALYMSYDNFCRVRLFVCRKSSPSVATYACRRVFLLYFLHLKRLNRFMKDGDVSIDLMNLKSRDDVVQMIQEAKQRGL